MEDRNLLKGIKRQLEQNDYRLTSQREAVLRVLIDEKQGHLSAEDVFLRAKDLAPDIGLATVYRTLELLEKINVAYKLQSGDGQARYELNYHKDEHYHHHLICLKCGAITEFNDDLLEEIEKRVALEASFQVTDHCLRFFGYCKNCRESS